MLLTMAPDPRSFVDAVTALLTDEPRRAALSAAALAAGRQLDWDVLARRYEKEVIEPYLPHSPALIGTAAQRISNGLRHPGR